MAQNEEHALVSELRGLVDAPEAATVGSLAHLIQRLSAEIGFLNGLAPAVGEGGSTPEAGTAGMTAGAFWNLNSDEIVQLGEMLRAIEAGETASDAA